MSQLHSSPAFYKSTNDHCHHLLSENYLSCDSYRSGWLWGDSETGAPSLQVHLLGKSGRIQFIWWAVTSLFFTSLSLFFPLSWCDSSWTPSQSSSPCAYNPWPLVTVEASTLETIWSWVVSGFIRLAACGQRLGTSSKLVLPDTEAMAHLGMMGRVLHK